MDLRDGKNNVPAGPDEQVFFDKNTPTTVGVVFDPNTPNTTDTLYVSSTNGSTWIYNGSAYVTYTAPEVRSTPFFITGTSIDAGSNKTAIIDRSGEVRVTKSTNAGFRTVSGAKSIRLLSTSATFNTLESSGGDLHLSCQDAYNMYFRTSNTERLRILSTGAIRFNSAYTFPTADGTANFVFKTDGAGNITFVNPSSIVSTQTITSAATVTPVSTNDEVIVTAQAVPLNYANPTGTFSEGQPVILRATDNGTARAITYGTKYRGTTLPTTTVVGSTIYIPLIYNATDDKFDNVSASGIMNTIPWFQTIALSDLTTALTAGTNKAYFRTPYAVTLTGVSASVLTAPTGGTLLTIDINEGGVSILSTKLTFDASEKTTITAATPAVISDTALALDSEITFDIDAVGSTVAGAGLLVTLKGTISL